MLHATSVIRKAAVKADRVAETVWLDHAARQSRKAALRSHGGLEFRLDLDRVIVLNDGDALKLDDGRLVLVRAAPQPLLEIRAENPVRLMRFAWSMGQRHIPVEFKAEAIYVEEYPALAEMARGQGCSVRNIMRPFHPEPVEQHACEHHDHHVHDARDHAGHDHAGHDHSQSGHEHGAGHGCDHNHGHKHEH